VSRVKIGPGDAGWVEPSGLAFGKPKDRLRETIAARTFGMIRPIDAVFIGTDNSDECGDPAER
jgi:hypothetical protein